MSHDTSASPEKLPVAVLGGTGYVAGELLRLLAIHPRFEVAAVLSESRAGTAIDMTFPNLHGTQPGGLRFADRAALDDVVGAGVAGLFSAAPHGASAPLVAELVDRGVDGMRVVDVSADFRFDDPSTYEGIYGQPHGAPELLKQFVCAVPEHHAGDVPVHAAQPGCFVTTVVLAAVPLVRSGLVHPEVFVTGITGSTGSGRTTRETTHHPERHSNLFAYKPLTHRHAPEMAHLAARAGAECAVHFVPHSGPFARGIHATLHARLAADADTADVLAALRQAYADAPFVEVVDGTPRVKDVVGSNRCCIGAAVAGGSVAVFSVLDNLVKGAAGGAVQWMNRLHDLPETAGLQSPGPAWT